MERRALASARAAALVALLVIAPALAACSGGAVEPCADRPLRLGFYAHFPPVSASADPDPASPGFNVQTGYEGDLMTALEAMEGAGIAFERRGIPVWEGIWLRAADDGFDVIGGGITILDSRRRDASGAEAITFTRGHVAFPQSLLARAEDAARHDGYGSLTSADRVGAFAGATGETRLLRLAGLTDADGVLAAGARVVTPAGEFEADGSERWFITAGGASPEFAGRARLLPPSGDQPEVVYVTDDGGGAPEERLVALLLAGDVDLASMSEVSAIGYARDSGGALAVAAVEEERPLGGLALAIGDAGLARCLSDRIDDLTDGRRIGFAQWTDDPSVFMERARQWNAGR